MERHAVGDQTQVASQYHKVHRHVTLAAKLAGQRPVGCAAALGQNTDVNFGARGRLGDVAQICLGVGGVHSDPLLVEVADVAALLDGVAVAAAFRRYI